MTTPPLVLTADQNTALTSIKAFILDPHQTVFVLQGYSGTGKSTVVKTILTELPNYLSMLKLVVPDAPEYIIKLTATTNKAAENLAQITGQEVTTIHSLLKLRVLTDYKTDTTRIIESNRDKYSDLILFIDEASCVNSELLEIIMAKTVFCKIIFIGDPAQMLAVKSKHAPVFSGFSGVKLTEVIRQKNDNPILDLSTKFRDTVNTGKFFGFKPDGFHIQHLNNNAFNQKLIDDISNPKWKYTDSKILTWTNKTAISYNNFIRSNTQKPISFTEGEYAICNSYISVNKKNIKTDSMVLITFISEDTQQHDVLGNFFTLDDCITTFMPKSNSDRKARLALARKQKEFFIVKEIEETWVDLRGAYAQTINKSQGSTYDRVFIDLDDVGKCNSGDQIARMLYVAVSRAKFHVYFKGDFKH